jgi:hypothetical protein
VQGENLKRRLEPLLPMALPKTLRVLGRGEVDSSCEARVEKFFIIKKRYSPNNYESSYIF